MINNKLSNNLKTTLHKQGYISYCSIHVYFILIILIKYILI